MRSLFLILCIIISIGCKTSQSLSDLKNNGLTVADPDHSATVYIVGVQKCSGAFVGPDPHILTAAHCLGADPFKTVIKIRVGSDRWLQSDRDPMRIALAPNWDKNEAFDVAVITLARGTSLPASYELGTEVPGPGDLANLSGYGGTQDNLNGPAPDPNLPTLDAELREGAAPVVSAAELIKLNGKIAANLLTIKDTSIGFGDHGGPLVFKGKIIGVAHKAITIDQITDPSGVSVYKSLMSFVNLTNSGLKANFLDVALAQPPLDPQTPSGPPLPPGKWFLGVSLSPAPTGGMLVNNVVKGSAAETAGILKGDVLTVVSFTDAVGNKHQALLSADNTLDMLVTQIARPEVVIQYKRGVGAPATANVVLTRRPTK